jgi:hypothetical protein
LNMGMVTYVVPHSAMPVPFDPILHQAVVTLQIVPKGTDSDSWVVVGPVVCHYQAQGLTTP